MREPDVNAFRKQREDVVLSVCFSDLAPTARCFDTLRKLADTLDQIYRFREIILVVDEIERDAFLELVEQVPDVRLFVVRKGTEYYERRVIAAEEAIGDIVVVGNVDEIEHMDVLALIEQTEREHAITLANCAKRRPIKDVFAWPFIALGRLAGFRVDPSDFQTIALPRTLLNHILSHAEPRLALRFPPRDPRLPVTGFSQVQNVASRSAFADIPRRAQLFQTLLVHLTPTILTLVALTSSFLALVGLGYAAYILSVLVVVESLAPGWLTTNAMLALSAVFMGFSTLGLSLGLQHLLKLHRKDNGERVSEEVNRIDLFGKVATDLNVELESESQPVLRGDG